MPKLETKWFQKATVLSYVVGSPYSQQMSVKYAFRNTVQE